MMSVAQDHGRARQFDYYTDRNSGLIEHYDNIGAREGDVALAFALAGNPENARVLEIGCGQGREARAIVRRTPFYQGIDIAADLVELAQQRVPKAEFLVADALTYVYQPAAYDIVFAFASLRHFGQDGVTLILQKVRQSLKPGGILYISSNYGDQYSSLLEHGDFGARQVTLYNPTLIHKLAGPQYRRVYETIEHVAGEQWFDLALQKKS